MKKVIVVPTDFSHNASVAARYALQFASLQGYGVHFLHAYLPFASAFQNPKANEKDEQRVREAAENDMKAFLEKLEAGVESVPTSNIVKGKLADSLDQFIKERPVALVIMGTHGTSGTRKDVLGSNTYDVAQSISVPLIVVPEHITEFRLHNTVLFTDYQKNDVQTLSEFKTVISGQEVPCTLVHLVPEANEEVTEHGVKLEEWKQHLKKEVGYELLEIHLAQNKENLERVNEIMDHLDADLSLLTLVEGRGFFEKLFHKSLAREIVLHPKRPVFLSAGS